LLTVVGGLLGWTWREFLKGDFFTWTFRFITLAAFAYLVADRLYETDATISVSASDPNDPLLFPFTITNISHIFSIRDVHWNCGVESIKTPTGTIQNMGFRPREGEETIIKPGQTINIDCDLIGPSAGFFPGVKTFKEIKLQIAASYSIEIFGLYSWKRTTQPVRFAWFSNASNPQWVRGDFANSYFTK